MSLRQRTGPCQYRRLKNDKTKFLRSAILFVVLSGHSKDSPRSPRSLSRLGELHVEAGYVPTLLAS